MLTLGSAKYAIGATVAVALLAACSSAASGVPGAGMNSLTPQSVGHIMSTLTAVKPLDAIHPDRGPSRFSPDKHKKKKGALWISDDSSNDIFVYSLPKLTETMTLTGFNEPQGMCTTKTGDVWIANTGTEQMLEYSPAGKEIVSVTDYYGYPVGCAVDAQADLAVTDIFGFSGSGQVVFYCCSTAGVKLSNPSQYYYYFVTFDPKGNIFVDGKSSAGSFMLSECPRGRTSCSTVNISGATIYFPGFTQWDNRKNDLVVGDQLCGDTESACAYSMTISGSTATVTGKTTFENYKGGADCDLVQGALNAKGNQFGAGMGPCGSVSATADIWAFPAGGVPTAYSATDLGEPIGATFTK